MLATMPVMAVNWSSPIFWAIMIGWIMSVTLHEFAHGLVAYLGGDYTIRERGLLTLNPMKYANPMMTFVLPLLFVAMGAIPMVGAATYVNVGLLRTRGWRSLTAAAGPAVNFILFVACIVPLYPRFGWLDATADPETWTATQVFCGAMAVIQLFACFINLLPVPPLDGFNIVHPYLPGKAASRLREPQIAFGILLVLFFVLSTKEAGELMFRGLFSVLSLMGVNRDVQYFIVTSFNTALFKPGG
jgi:Zn-dependent protease